MPPSLEELTVSVEILPGEPQLERLARAVVARERRQGRPADEVRIEVWRVEFDAGSLMPRIGCCGDTSSVRLRNWVTCPGRPGPIHVALRLTLIWLLLRPMGPWYVRAPLLLLSMLGLVSGLWLRAPAVWLALARLVAVRLFVEWPLPDNHIYLLGYWCLGIALALRLADPASQLARTGRLLLGIVFAFAVLWKAVLSPDYRDGRFFAVTMLTDDRFADAVQLLGGLNDAQLRENRDYLTPLPGGAELLEPRVLQAPGRFARSCSRRRGGHSRWRAWLPYSGWRRSRGVY